VDNIKKYSSILFLLLLLIGCNNKPTKSENNEIYPNKAITAGIKHNEILENTYSRLLLLLNQNYLITDQNFNQSLNSVMYDEFLSQGYFTDKDEYINYFQKNEDLNILTENDSIMFSKYKEVACSSSLCSDEENLILDLLSLMDISSENNYKTRLDSLHLIAVSENYDKEYPVYFQVIDTAYWSASYWDDNIDKWNNLIESLYAGQTITQNSTRLLVLADLGGAIIGGAASGVGGGSTGEIVVSAVVNGALSSVGWVWISRAFSLTMFVIGML